MGRTVLVTGATGALGPHVVTELLRCEDIDRVFVLLRCGPRWHRHLQDLRTCVVRIAEAGGFAHAWSSRLITFAGDVGAQDLGLDAPERDRLAGQIDVVVHAAAITRFSAPECELRRVNVEGTRHALAFAARCSNLRQILFVSTTCVAGTTTGTIPERLAKEPTAFVNGYERTKWEAERLAANAGLPVRIARLSTCIGSEHDGYVHRLGAIHQVLGWAIRGLVPMVPAVDGARLDLIATDLAARWIARAAQETDCEPSVCQIAAGDHAIPLRDVLDFVVAHLRKQHPAWRSRQIQPPVIADAAAFKLFERSVGLSGDALFSRMLDAGRSFFPSLLYPKVYQTAAAERLWGGPLAIPDWRSTLGKVIDFLCAREQRRRRGAVSVHV